MPHPNTRGRKPAAAAVVILLLACVGLAACGGSSSTTSTGANAASTRTASTGTGSTGSTGTASTGTSSSGSSTSSTGAGRGGARFAAVRECLEKNGITLPQRAPGSGGHAGARGGLLGAGAGALPKGVTRAQYEAALRKCGAGATGLGRGTPLANNHVFEAALAKFAECLRQNGVNVPAPNTSGKGPVFDTKGINTSSPQFRAATTKCRATLTSAFRSAR
jgi:hypothetical protein